MGATATSQKMTLRFIADNDLMMFTSDEDHRRELLPMAVPGANLKLEVRRLVTGEEPAVLNFLNRQPLRNVAMIGFIRDHGLESERNRGTFYGCFRNGWLIGVALLGHFVILSGPEETLPVFADVARLWHEDEIRVVLGNQETIGLFGRLLKQTSSSPKLPVREAHVLWALTEATDDDIEMLDVRPARLDELEEVTQVHAQAYREQLSVDPLAMDPHGFRQRVQSRVEKGRVWIARDAQGIAFKADVPFDTGEAIYLEGVWVRPELRGAGCGRQMMKALCQLLLQEHHVVCLFSRADDQRAMSFYQRVGFQSLAPYQIIRYES